MMDSQRGCLPTHAQPGSLAHRATPAPALPLWVYLPASPEFQGLATTVRSQGARVVADWGALRQARPADWLVPPGDVLRLNAWQLPMLEALFAGAAPDVAPQRPAILLAAELAVDLPHMMAQCERLSAHAWQVWAEVTSLAQARSLQDRGACGLVACGLESGGWVSPQSTLVLVRELATGTDIPVVARAAPGPDAVAALIAAGAAGAALGDQLALLQDYPANAAHRALLERFDGTDTRVLGHALGFDYRVYAQLATAPAREMARREVEALSARIPAGHFLDELSAAKAPFATALDPRKHLVAMGQDAASATTLAQRYGTLQGVLGAIAQHLTGMQAHLAQDFALAPGKGIAHLHGTRLALHQGPMAQVSDTPAFARAVARSGSMPWLALGNMPDDVARELVEKTTQALADLPGAFFGAGIIGLEANPWRNAHMALLKARGPVQDGVRMMVMVAAGSAELALELEAAGLQTWLHTPTPAILRAAMASGLRRFIAEGSEAGGHVGHLGAMALWQMAVMEMERALADSPHLSTTEPHERPWGLVLAGGISDAGTAAAAATMLQGLHRRGVHTGIQMGTAYLMTKEAVTTGALSPVFQQIAREQPRTVLMGQTVNTPTRVLDTPAARTVVTAERERLEKAVDLKHRKHLYEHDNLGGLRAAAKAQRIERMRDSGQLRFVSLEATQQREVGLFHCGQGIALSHGVRALHELHEEVTTGAQRLAIENIRRAFGQVDVVAAPAPATPAASATPMTTPQAASKAPATSPDESTSLAPHLHVTSVARWERATSLDETPEFTRAIAIVGIGACLPGATDKNTFWHRVLEGYDAIGPVTEDRWDPELFYDPDPAAPDKTYSKIGGWLGDFAFDRKAFRLPPRVLQAMDRTQQVCLMAVRQALVDAGYHERDFDRSQCAVILGNSLGGDLRDSTSQRVLFAGLARLMRQSMVDVARGQLTDEQQERLVREVEARFKASSAAISEDSMAGELSNVIAGRVAQFFDLQGPNLVTDAACASSLAAVESAVRGLRTHQFDMAITGGVDCAMGAATFVKFAKIGALSPDGSRPFDAGANGFVMGEGAGILVLKRLKDALRDGDQVYALIQGVGASSDGRGKAITAPNPEGQKLAIARAYADAGYSIASVSLIEAHGTSTPVGDPIEVQSLRAIWEQHAGTRQGRVALGSVKSNIGHLKAAAGAAGLIKAALAIKHRLVPPTRNITNPHAALALERGPFYLPLVAEPWEHPAGGELRAGVSAFGFGGTNFHVTLEAFDPERLMRQRPGANARSRTLDHATGPALPVRSDTPASAPSLLNKPSLATQPVGPQSRLEAHNLAPRDRMRDDASFVDVSPAPILSSSPAAPGGGHVLGLEAATLEGLARQLQALSESGATLDEGALARHLLGPGTWQGGASSTARSVRLAVVFRHREELVARLERAREAAQSHRGWRLLAQQGIFLSEGAQEEIGNGRLAMLFPGQGSQYLGMLAGLRTAHPIVQATFEEADAIMAPILKARLSDYINPDLSRTPESNAQLALMQTEVTQPAVLAADIALMRLLNTWGIQPDVVAGHSLGEYAACVASGVMSFEDALRTVAARGTEMARATPADGDPGRMASIPATIEEIQPILDTIPGYVVCANINCRNQTIIAGATDAVEQAIARFQSMGRTVVVLPVSHAFHTRVVAMASKPLRHHLQGVSIRAPRLPILTNVTADYYPAGPGAEDAIRDLLAEQVAAPVRFMDMIERMHADGVRRFVEVGPKRALSSFVANILEARPHLSLYTNHPQKSDACAFLEAIAQLWVHQQRREDPVARIPSTRPASSRPQVLARLVDTVCKRTGYDPAEIEESFELEADLGIDTVKQAEIMADVRRHFALEKDHDFRLAEYPTIARLVDYVLERTQADESPSPARGSVTALKADVVPGPTPNALRHEAHVAHEAPARAAHASQAPAHIAPHPQVQARPEVLARIVEAVCQRTGYDPAEIEESFELEADLGIDTVKQAEIMADVRRHFALAKDHDFRLAEYPTIARLVDYVLERTQAGKVTASAPPASPMEPPAPPMTASEPAPTSALTPGQAPDHRRDHGAAPHSASAISITGCALGLPGLGEVFAPDAVERLLEGTSFIGDVPPEVRQAMVDKHIVRVHKHPDGTGEMREVRHPGEVIKLAGTRGSFDLGQWALPPEITKGLDTTTQMAIAAGLMALGDARLPLVPRYRETRQNKRVQCGWTLPEAVGRTTGVIFASAFAGQEALLGEVRRWYARHEDEAYHFPKNFLVRVLGNANTHFAELVGARGPNLRINNACASTTTAMALAQDWIRSGRAERVVILGADNASGPDLMEWIGSGFLAAGAATTEEDVTRAALPFDRRRHGMIVGMGAVAFVLERAGLPEARGLEPIADLLATHVVNSAGHPTRLDVDHIASEVRHFVHETAQARGLAPEEMARRTVFVSHETYTPARGGSASAEVAALRSAFGEEAREVLIANTKGFTGHAMAAGIEDVLAIRALQHQRVPPIANFREQDPELGPLNLSQGGHAGMDLALRLSAGFGSQLAVALFQARARSQERVHAPHQLDRWLAHQTGWDSPELFVQDRTLRARQAHASAGDAHPVDNGHVAARDTANAKWTPRKLVVAPTRPHAVSPEALEAAFNGKRILVLAGPVAITRHVMTALKALGSHATALGRGWENSVADIIVEHCDPSNESALGATLQAMGHFDGVINLLGFGAPEDGPQEAWQAARRSFGWARVWATQGRHEASSATGQAPFVLTLTGMDGRMGLETSPSWAPTCAAVAGMTKALAHEWPKARVQVVDVPAVGWRPGLVHEALVELLRPKPAPEVGLGAGGRSVPAFMALRAYDAGQASATHAPRPGDVWLVTGGARGITAEILVALAKEVSCTFAVVGRTALTHPNPLGIDASLERQRVRQDLEARTPNNRVTPAMVRDAMQTLEREAEIARNIARIEAYGARVRYYACDLGQMREVETLVGRVRREFGPIRGLLHGAGIEDSRLVADKPPETFQRVYASKALAAQHIWQALSSGGHEPPAYLVAFSSVAGRFGNAGQTDYCAANEALARLWTHLGTHASLATGPQAPHPTPATLCLDWTAWADTGMAASEAMTSLLQSRGVELLPAEIGARIGAQAIARGLCGEYVVAGALGPMRPNGLEELAAEPGTQGHASTWREENMDLVERILVREPGHHIAIERHVSPSQDTFLRDHVYEGTPLMPGVMGLEMMAQAAWLLTGQAVLEVAEVAFERAIKCHGDEPMRLVARLTRAEGPASAPSGEGDWFDAVLESARTIRTGRELVQEHFRARLKTGPSHILGSKTPMHLDPAHATGQGPGHGEIYRHMFHTGIFRVLERIGCLANDYVIAHGRMPAVDVPGHANQSAQVTAPMALEMALQAIGFWGMQHHGMSYLPHAIGQLQLSGHLPGAGQPVVVRARRGADTDAHMLTFDVEVLDQRGTPVLWAKDVRLMAHRLLTENEKPSPLRPLAPEVFGVSVAEAAILAQGLWPTPSSGEGLLSHILHSEELAQHARHRHPQRQGEWLAARVAAKTLLAGHLRDHYGMAVKPSDILIAPTEQGAPVARLLANSPFREDPAKAPLPPLPALSLTHSHGLALAALAPMAGNARVGVDLERMEPRDPAFAQNWFDPAELALVLEDGDQRQLPAHAVLTGLWSAKEAASKALGLGLHLTSSELRILALKPLDAEHAVLTQGHAGAMQGLRQAARAYVGLAGRAKEAYEALSGHDWQVWVYFFDDLVLAMTSFGGSRAPSVPVHHKGHDATAAHDADVTAETMVPLEGAAAQATLDNGHSVVLHAGASEREVVAAVLALLRHKNYLEHSGRGPGCVELRWHHTPEGPSPAQPVTAVQHEPSRPS